MKCNIIRDLLPMYCDKLTSEESNEEIVKHLSGCPACAEVYKSMTSEDIKIPESAKDIRPLKKLRRIIGVLAASAGVLLLTYICVIVYVFFIQKPLDPSELIAEPYITEITSFYSDDSGNMSNASASDAVWVKFSSINGKAVDVRILNNDSITEQDGTVTHNINLQVYSAPIRFGADDCGNIPIGSGISERSVITICGNGETVTYNIRELCRDYGIDPDKLRTAQPVNESE